MILIGDVIRHLYLLLQNSQNERGEALLGRNGGRDAKSVHERDSHFLYHTYRLLTCGVSTRTSADIQVSHALQACMSDIDADSSREKRKGIPAFSPALRGSMESSLAIDLSSENTRAKET